MTPQTTYSIAFTVRSVPVSQPRQRVAVIAGRARNYTPPRLKEEKLLLIENLQEKRAHLVGIETIITYNGYRVRH